jgi:isocitrate dehydrogenase
VRNRTRIAACAECLCRVLLASPSRFLEFSGLHWFLEIPCGDMLPVLRRCNVGVKCQTITPNAKWVAELGLKRMYPSPNTTIRSILGGTIVREPFTCSSIPQLIPGWMEPVIVCRHAVADHTEAAEIDVQGPGMVEIFFTSADGEARRCATLSDYRLRRQDV